MSILVAGRVAGPALLRGYGLTAMVMFLTFSAPVPGLA